MNIVIPTAVLDGLMPMHLLLGADFRIAHVGPTLAKLAGRAELVGRPLLEVFDTGGAGPKALDRTGRRSFALNLRLGHGTRLRGVLFDLGEAAGGGAILNLSVNVTEFERLDSAGLTLHDFAANDLIADILYLIEANTAVKAEAHRLIRRLQGLASSATELAVTDMLTGLKNRRALDKALARLIARRTPFALILLDLDMFKAVNDTHGHAAGDAVLVHVARALTGSIRSSDTVARVGGDEFVILLPGETSPARIAQVAERIIARVEAPVLHNGVECRVSTSLGTALSIDYPSPDAERMFADADRALYASKDAGRGTHTFARDLPPPGRKPNGHAPG